MHAEAARNRNWIDETTERSAPREHEVVPLREVLRGNAGEPDPLDRAGHFLRAQPGRVDGGATSNGGRVAPADRELVAAGNDAPTEHWRGHHDVGTAALGVSAQRGHEGVTVDDAGRR